MLSGDARHRACAPLVTIGWPSRRSRLKATGSLPTAAQMFESTSKDGSVSRPTITRLAPSSIARRIVIDRSHAGIEPEGRVHRSEILRHIFLRPTLENRIEIGGVDLRDAEDVGVDLGQRPRIAGIDRPARGILNRRVNVPIARASTRMNGAAAQQVEDADDLQSVALLGDRTMVLPPWSRVNSWRE